MSSSLLWQLTRKSTARTYKRTHPKVALTNEKGSLTNVRKSADSGLCTARAVYLDLNEAGAPEMLLKNAAADDARRPDKMWKPARLGGGVRKALARTDRAVGAYRPAAKKLALRRVSALYRAQARKNRGVTHASLKTGRTVAAE